MTVMRVGAVRYLNMLPYFFDSHDVEIFDSPALLNEAMRHEQVDAACMSAIAGIKSGFTPLEPMMGVASNENVGSVFLEPLLETPDQHLFWTKFLTLNSKGEIKVDNVESRTHVAIFSSGASEQSLWLARLLLHWQGHKTTVHLVDKKLSKDIEASDVVNFLKNTAATQALFLSIGDIALYRVFEQKFVHPGCRWDVAQLWKHARGVPCVFATLFVRSGIAAWQQRQLATQLMNSLDRWHTQGAAQQLAHAEAFLRQKNDPLVESLQTQSVTNAMAQYFRELDFVFSEPYRATYSQYLTFSNVDF